MFWVSDFTFLALGHSFAATQGGLDSQATGVKEISSSESTGLQKGRKVVSDLPWLIWSLKRLLANLLFLISSYLNAFWYLCEDGTVVCSFLTCSYNSLTVWPAIFFSHPTPYCHAILTTTCILPCSIFFFLFSWMCFIFMNIPYFHLYRKYYYCDSLYFIYCLQEATETKRKNAKRTFKSEKEFLEFTLKYQQVLTERDAGEFECVCSAWSLLSLYLINLIHP